MECNKNNGKFLKVKAKVKGFLIIKKEKRNKPEQVIVMKKRNTILSTGLQDLLNAFQVYMSGITYKGNNAPGAGIILTLSSSQQIALPFIETPTILTNNNSVTITFTAVDTSESSYTATSEELVTQSAGYNIPIATANLTMIKQSDEILILTWIITISISVSEDLMYIPLSTPSPAGVMYCTASSGCNNCYESAINSEYSYSSSGCSPIGLTSQYPETNFVTSTLFSDIIYNTYGKNSLNLFTQVSGTTLIIYTLYCLEYFVAGLVQTQTQFIGQFTTFVPNEESCFTPTRDSSVQVAYIQVYSPSETAPYIGVQIEFTT